MSGKSSKSGNSGKSNMSCVSNCGLHAFEDWYLTSCVHDAQPPGYLPTVDEFSGLRVHEFLPNVLILAL